MPNRFNELATYNGEVSRGIVHTPEMVERMRQLQADFNAWRRECWDADGAIVLDDVDREFLRRSRGG